MREKSLCLMAVIGLLCGPPAAAQDAGESMQSAVAAYSEWIEVMADITRGVEIDEPHLLSFLDHYPDLEELDLEDMDTDDPAAFKQSFEAALTDPRYLSWAAARGLDPGGFLRGSMRVTSLFMLEQAAVLEAQEPRQWADQTKMVEEQCARVDQKTCDEMKAALESSRSMSRAMAEARGQLRPASASERALLDRYGPELQAVMASEDDDEDPYEDDEDFYEEDDGFFRE